eukprot:TRINITY_DN27093_c0_g1_i1.p1 TRINITY_DN27093_c0_g1~~TRINITY_DN27093_c0_g1_i1.p1  ORF type:complete len:307 (+),score=28.30 TRINITY_DN27093_c0_g1_i1:52-972(+)
MCVQIRYSKLPIPRAQAMFRGRSRASDAVERMSLTDVCTLLRIQAPQPGQLTLLSGGAAGADSLFDSLLAEFLPEARCIHWSFREHVGFASRPGGRVNLPDVFAGEVADPHLRVAAAHMGTSVPKKPMVKALFRRNVFQALWADALVAVTWEDVSAEYPHRVGGGTKWAVQVYLDRFQPLGPEPAGNCRLMFYEVNSAQWRRWIPLDQCWEVLDDPPELDSSWWFAGIGTREVPEHAAQATRELLRSLMGSVVVADGQAQLDTVEVDGSRSASRDSAHQPQALDPATLPKPKRRWQRVQGSQQAAP